jgi:sterol desaturase/sphingolipid hydroxylase (fatty acid hydroxylase superfamily)
MNYNGTASIHIFLLHLLMILATTGKKKNFCKRQSLLHVTVACTNFDHVRFHRAAHEINLFWAAHQVHHSSEDYNLSTALRQSILQVYTSWVCSGKYH